MFVEKVRHQSKSLDYITVHPNNYQQDETYPLVILLHGFGANKHDLTSLSAEIDADGYVYAYPNAPFAVQIGPGMMGYAWEPPGGDSPEQATWVEARLMAFCREVIEQYAVSPGRVVLGGFSQGAGMTYRCGLGRPDLFGGLIALSGALRDLRRLQDTLPTERGQAIFIAHGTDDNLALVENAREVKDFLVEEGYSPSYNEYPIAHEITPEVLADMIPWLHHVLPPSYAR
jgi:phospholipase/carboxylesterase